MANNRKPSPDEDERKGWYYHFDTFFGGFGWIIGLFMAIAVISTIHISLGRITELAEYGLDKRKVAV